MKAGNRCCLRGDGCGGRLPPSPSAPSMTITSGRAPAAACGGLGGAPARPRRAAIGRATWGGRAVGLAAPKTMHRERRRARARLQPRELLATLRVCVHPLPKQPPPTLAHHVRAGRVCQVCQRVCHERGLRAELDAAPVEAALAAVAGDRRDEVRHRRAIVDVDRQGRPQERPDGDAHPDRRRAARRCPPKPRGRAAPVGAADGISLAPRATFTPLHGTDGCGRDARAGPWCQPRDTQFFNFNRSIRVIKIDRAVWR